jgi:hypothetical protein
MAVRNGLTLTGVVVLPTASPGFIAHLAAFLTADTTQADGLGCLRQQPSPGVRSCSSANYAHEDRKGAKPLPYDRPLAGQEFY